MWKVQVGTSVGTGTGTGTGTDGGSAMMQKFWDSAMDIGPDDDSDNRRLVSLSQIEILASSYYCQT